MSVEDWELKQVPRNLEELSLFAVTLPSREDKNRFNKSEQSLKGIAVACRDLANDLRGILEPLKIEDADEGSQRKWKAFMVALQWMKKSGKIDDMLGRQVACSLVMNVR